MRSQTLESDIAYLKDMILYLDKAVVVFERVGTHSDLF